MSTGVPVKTTKKSFEVIDQLVALEKASLNELTETLDMPKGTLHGHLKTLCELGMVINDRGTYRPSMRFLNYGTRIRNNNKLFQAARSELNQLSQETGEHATLIIEEQGRGVIYYIVEGNHPTKLITRAGIRTYLHTNACGKAILADMSRERVEQIIAEQGLPAQTNHTITDRERLFEELERVREQGYATNEDEALKGMKAVGASVQNTEDEVIGAVSVFGPARRIDNTRLTTELSQRIREAANVIEVNYNYE
ncbi:IclR family transcriptional regulator [Haladaptatus sp. ZSTT2]|uniref:IclR family transcriptional regulator n=1 Tax=Haladaptatus sp. ZSTT2 TaxID=3120515 RepID=UPI00300F1057